MLWISDWSSDRLYKLWKDLGHTVERATTKESNLRKLYPHLDLRWWHRHPVIAGLLGAVATIVYVMAIIMPFIFTSG
ncbi:hypothetical protein ABZ897_54285 [Nonomuraea sp. NPDC046802]|uniref:hypothetical protein n=1 Tax=Nonomuraea sp. NPDC046802 TaxID=3154919 RepID=UPI0033E74AF5